MRLDRGASVCRRRREGVDERLIQYAGVFRVGIDLPGVEEELLRARSDRFDRLDKIDVRDEFATRRAARLQIAELTTGGDRRGAGTGEVEYEDVVVVRDLRDVGDSGEHGVARRVCVGKVRDIAFRPLRVFEQRVTERARVVYCCRKIVRRARVVAYADDNRAIFHFVEELVGRLLGGRGDAAYEMVRDGETELVGSRRIEIRYLARCYRRLKGSDFLPARRAFYAIFELNVGDVVGRRRLPRDGRDRVHYGYGVVGEVLRRIRRVDIARLREAAER